MSDLNINVGANVTAYNRAMAGIKSSVANTSNMLNSRLGTMIGFGAITYSAVKFINILDNVAKASKNIGISAQYYMQLSYAANKAGSSIDIISGAIKRMQRNIIDKNITELQGKTVEEQLRASVDAYNSITDATQKSAFAAQMFGKSGQELQTFLKDYNALMDEAKDKVLISDSTVKAAEDLHDRYEDLVNSLGNLASASGVFETLAKGANSLKAEIADLQKAFDEITQAQKVSISGDYANGLWKMSDFFGGMFGGEESGEAFRMEGEKPKSKSQRVSDSVNKELDLFFGGSATVTDKSNKSIIASVMKGSKDNTDKKIKEEEHQLDLLRKQNDLSEQEFELYKINADYDKKIAEAKDEKLKSILESQRQESLEANTKKNVDKELTNFFGDIKPAESAKPQDVFRGMIYGSDTFGKSASDTLEKKSLNTLEKIEGHLNTMKNKSTTATYG